MNQYDVVFTLKNGEKVEATFCQYKRENLLKAIQVRLGTRKYWEVLHTEGSVVLVTDHVESFTVSEGSRYMDEEPETNVFTFPALIYKEKADHALYDFYNIVFPDLDTMSGGDSMMDAVHHGKEALEIHLENQLENFEETLKSNPYFQRPSKSQEEAVERHREQLPEFFEEVDLKGTIELVYFMDITVHVKVVRKEWKYFLSDINF